MEMYLETRKKHHIRKLVQVEYWKVESLKMYIYIFMLKLKLANLSATVVTYTIYEYNWIVCDTVIIIM